MNERERVKKLRDERDPAAPGEARALSPREPALAERVLALQRTVGNRAVGAMLARDASTAEAEPADAKSPGGSRASIEMGALGQIALDSYAFPVSSGGSGGGGGVGGGGLKQRDFNLQSRIGKHSPKLAQAVAEGTHYESAVIDGGRVIYRMADVMVSSYQTLGGDGKDASGPESWSINFAKVEYEYKKLKDE